MNFLNKNAVFLPDFIPSALLPNFMLSSVISIFTIFALFKLSNIVKAFFNSMPFLTGVPVDGIYLHQTKHELANRLQSLIFLPKNP